MKKSKQWWITARPFGTRPVLWMAAALWLASPAHAESPWETAVAVLRDTFTGPIARGLGLVAIVLSGFMFAFQDGDSKRTMAGVPFGVGMAIGAVNFMNWLFPG
jgi:type IV secretory pathway VirB2 component (pilin)